MLHQNTALTRARLHHAIWSGPVSFQLSPLQLPLQMNSSINSVFIGQKNYLMPEGHPTGIFKTKIKGSVSVTKLGLTGDYQADRRVHGGPEKAVHHYPAENYEILIRKYGALTSSLVPGALGENFSTVGLTERNICIGDIFSVGNVLLQVSQPRRPCWKINHKFGIETVSRFIQSNCITGWYYRVLAEGVINEGEHINLMERLNPGVTVANFLGIVNSHRPDQTRLKELENLTGLSQVWKTRVKKRVDWLEKTTL